MSEERPALSGYELEVMGGGEPAPVCATCGRELPAYRGYGRPARYCPTTECKAIAEAGRRKVKPWKPRAPDGKICRGCAQWRPPGEFYSSRNSADGMNTLCRRCWNRRHNKREMGPYPVECWVCGTVFEAAKPTEKYCTDTCYETGRDYPDANGPRTLVGYCETPKPGAFKDRCGRPFSRSDRRKRCTECQAEKTRVMLRKKGRRQRAQRRDMTNGPPSMFVGVEPFRHSDGCVYCSEILPRKLVTRDHVIPVSIGGPHEDANLVGCCGSCNSIKGNRLPFVEWTPPAPVAGLGDYCKSLICMFSSRNND